MLSNTQLLCHNCVADRSPAECFPVYRAIASYRPASHGQLMTDRELEEYKALRATIRQRGTARAWVFGAGLAAWATLALATTLVSLPLITVIPLLLLAATFEVVFGLHVAVERIGRYLQVFYEDRWEQTAMAFGAPMAGTRTDPLFAVYFGAA